jgi:DNA-binding transcriptional LysR family regulator
MKMRGRLKVSSGEGLREAVLSGLGIAVVSEWLFSPELASGAVESASTIGLYRCRISGPYFRSAGSTAQKRASSSRSWSAAWPLRTPR